MKLFDIDPDIQQIKLNREWIFLVPEFAAILRRDKGSPGDNEGRKKLQATKEFSYIYFMVDFSSPLRDYNDEDRHKESLRMARLDKVDDVVLTAKETYKALYLKASRSLKTYSKLQKALDAMDDYYDTLDMAARDKQGKLLNNPLDVAGSVKKLDEMHTAVANFAKRVEEELTQALTIRGPASELGDKEGRKVDNWSESDIATGSGAASGGKGIVGRSFMELGQVLNGTKDNNGIINHSNT